MIPGIHSSNQTAALKPIPAEANNSPPPSQALDIELLANDFQKRGTEAIWDFFDSHNVEKKGVPLIKFKGALLDTLCRATEAEGDKFCTLYKAVYKFCNSPHLEKNHEATFATYYNLSDDNFPIITKTVVHNKAYLFKWLLERTNTRGTSHFQLASFVNEKFSPFFAIVKHNRFDFLQYLVEQNERFKTSKMQGLDFFCHATTRVAPIDDRMHSFLPVHLALLYGRVEMAKIIPNYNHYSGEKKVANAKELLLALACSKNADSIRFGLQILKNNGLLNRSLFKARVIEYLAKSDNSTFLEVLEEFPQVYKSLVPAENHRGSGANFIDFIFAQACKHGRVDFAKTLWDKIGPSSQVKTTCSAFKEILKTTKVSPEKDLELLEIITFLKAKLPGFAEHIAPRIGLSLIKAGLLGNASSQIVEAIISTPFGDASGTAIRDRVDTQEYIALLRHADETLLSTRVSSGSYIKQREEFILNVAASLKTPSLKFATKEIVLIIKEQLKSKNYDALYATISNVEESAHDDKSLLVRAYLFTAAIYYGDFESFELLCEHYGKDSENNPKPLFTDVELHAYKYKGLQSELIAVSLGRLAHHQIQSNPHERGAAFEQLALVFLGTLSIYAQGLPNEFSKFASSVLGISADKSGSRSPPANATISNNLQGVLGVFSANLHNLIPRVASRLPDLMVNATGSFNLLTVELKKTVQPKVFIPHFFKFISSSEEISANLIYLAHLALRQKAFVACLSTLLYPSSSNREDYYARIEFAKVLLALFPTALAHFSFDKVPPDIQKQYIQDVALNDEMFPNHPSASAILFVERCYPLLKKLSLVRDFEALMKAHPHLRSVSLLVQQISDETDERVIDISKRPGVNVSDIRSLFQFAPNYDEKIQSEEESANHYNTCYPEHSWDAQAFVHNAETNSGILGISQAPTSPGNALINVLRAKITPEIFYKFENPGKQLQDQDQQTKDKTKVDLKLIFTNLASLLTKIENDEADNAVTSGKEAIMYRHLKNILIDLSIFSLSAKESDLASIIYILNDAAGYCYSRFGAALRSSHGKFISSEALDQPTDDESLDSGLHFSKYLYSKMATSFKMAADRVLPQNDPHSIAASESLLAEMGLPMPSSLFSFEASTAGTSLAYCHLLMALEPSKKNQWANAMQNLTVANQQLLKKSAQKALSKFFGGVFSPLMMFHQLSSVFATYLYQDLAVRVVTREEFDAALKEKAEYIEASAEAKSDKQGSYNKALTAIEIFECQEKEQSAKALLASLEDSNDDSGSDLSNESIAEARAVLEKMKARHAKELQSKQRARFYSLSHFLDGRVDKAELFPSVVMGEIKTDDNGLMMYHEDLNGAELVNLVFSLGLWTQTEETSTD